MSTPNASYSITMRLHYPNQVGMFSRIAAAISEAGGDVGAIDIVSVNAQEMERDVTINAADEAHASRIVERVREVPGLRLVNYSDRTFLRHLGGKIEIRSKVPVKTRDDLTMAYTPGVARVSRAIYEDPSKAYNLTIKGNTVAIVTDGTAVLGLGDIGPVAAMPVMEGKALLFKEFGGVDAFPLCLATKDVDEIVRTVQLLAPTFGGINLEDIAAPRCFAIEEQLKRLLDIPVFHDDQHGTAIVVLAALLNGLKIVGKNLADVRVVVSGVGAAGVACTRMLLEAGVGDVIGVDSVGAICVGRTENMSPVKEAYARQTNRERCQGKLSDVIRGADVFLGVSQPGVLTPRDVARMGRDPIVFALANPTPEIAWEDAAPHVRVLATGRSDYPNQINNVLAFPGVFRGALDCRAREINHDMKFAPLGRSATWWPRTSSLKKTSFRVSSTAGSPLPSPRPSSPRPRTLEWPAGEEPGRRAKGFGALAFKAELIVPYFTRYRSTIASSTSTPRPGPSGTAIVPSFIPIGCLQS